MLTSPRAILAARQRPQGVDEAETPAGRIVLTPEQANDAFLRAEEALKSSQEEADRHRRELTRL